MTMEPTAFDPTTLVTFIFRAPAEARTVELLGSWDNFNIPYRMHHDRRRGTGVWSGCFSFEGIVFDGWNLQWTKPRSGGLRQGGTYWYYYRLNYDLDCFDDGQPQTTYCPLLPGQKVNVLDVPTELVEPISRCHSACADIIGSLANMGQLQTMDPQNRSAVPEPPAVSKVHARSRSDAALRGKFKDQSAIVVEKTVSPVSPSCSPKTKPTDIVGTTASSEREPISSVDSCCSPKSSISGPVVHDSPDSGIANAEDEELPEFPYPGALGAGPLASLEALGAALFPAPELNVTARRNQREIKGSVPILTHEPNIRSSVLSLSPPSIHNVQFYGSRPGTNLTEDPEQHRPRMYSLPNLEIRDRQENSASGSPSSYCSPRSYEPDDNMTPEDEIAGYHLLSPTFSTATISTEGQTSPFRLSAQNSLASGIYIPSGTHEQNFDDVADRLRALDLGEEHSSARSSRNPPTRPPIKLTSFINYSLPTIASESNQSLAKTNVDPIVAPDPRSEVPVPLSIFTESEGTSMADDIFKAFGFLSGSIV